MLHGARSVIVVGGGKLNAGAYKSPAGNIAGYISSVKVSAVQRIAFKLADYIEQEFGYYAIYNARDLSSLSDEGLDDQLCAELAGLGVRAIAANRVLNPKYGFLHYSTVITTMPLRPDRPMQEQVCPDSECVEMYSKYGTTPCMRACPECLYAVLDDGRIREFRFNKVLHNVRSQTTSTSAFQRLLLEAINEEDKERRKMILLGNFFSRTVRAMAYKYNLSETCVECMRVCPVEKRSYGFIKEA